VTALTADQYSMAEHIVLLQEQIVRLEERVLQLEARAQSPVPAPSEALTTSGDNSANKTGVANHSVHMRQARSLSCLGLLCSPAPHAHGYRCCTSVSDCLQIFRSGVSAPEKTAQCCFMRVFYAAIMFGSFSRRLFGDAHTDACVAQAQPLIEILATVPAYGSFNFGGTGTVTISRSHANHATNSVIFHPEGASSFLLLPCLLFAGCHQPTMLQREHPTLLCLSFAQSLPGAAAPS